jgi:hypothetical protein
MQIQMPPPCRSTVFLVGAPFESLTVPSLSRSSRPRVKSRGGIQGVADPTEAPCPKMQQGGRPCPLVSAQAQTVLGWGQRLALSRRARARFALFLFPLQIFWPIHRGSGGRLRLTMLLAFRGWLFPLRQPDDKCSPFILLREAFDHASVLINGFLGDHQA